tara:strand:+ start:20 stop:556 length:537 start_codon:yes stop_codon:yes gene_type:complete
MVFGILLNNLNLKSIVSNKLANKEIKEICLLKDKQWKFGLNSQIKWFKSNIKKYDLHNLLYIGSKLIGYTCLRKRTYKIDNINKKTYYFLFDALTIDPKYRGKKLSNLFMSFNNLVIIQSGLFSILTCDNRLISFYKKNNWTKLNKKYIDFLDYPFRSNGMTFNKKLKNKKISFFINK